MSQYILRPFWIEADGHCITNVISARMSSLRCENYLSQVFQFFTGIEKLYMEKIKTSNHAVLISWRGNLSYPYRRRQQKSHNDFLCLFDIARSPIYSIFFQIVTISELLYLHNFGLHCIRNRKNGCRHWIRQKFSIMYKKWHRQFLYVIDDSPH